jgi:hypothetical protein
MLRSDAGNATRFGFGLGLGYDYSINSDYILSPEFLIQRFSTSGISAYGITGWSFGLRFSFGK